MQENGLIKLEWWKHLTEDCKAIVTEAVFTSRWALVEGYWNLGERINTDSDYQKWGTNKDNVLQDLANAIGLSTRTIYYALKTYEKYPSLDWRIFRRTRIKRTTRYFWGKSKENLSH
jgi:hypothetical protein